MNDKQIIDKILQNDKAAFGRLVEKYQSLVVNTAFGFVREKFDAEDIAQEVFIEAYNSIKNFRGDAGISTWLYRITVNKSLNFIRSKKRRHWIKSVESFFSKNNENTTQFAAPDSTDNGLEQKERSEILHDAIDNLSKNQKIAFTLHKYEDLSYKEIAKVMNVSLSSVESLIHRAKKNLQKQLVNYYKNN